MESQQLNKSKEKSLAKVQGIGQKAYWLSCQWVRVFIVEFTHVEFGFFCYFPSPLRWEEATKPPNVFAY